jgi:hypothetical protein
VLATAPDGLIGEHPDHGLFVHETRLLSRWRYSIDGEPPSPNAFSTVPQNHWAGYFVIAAPDVTPPPRDDGSGQVPDESRNLLELRVTRLIDDGFYEYQRRSPIGPVHQAWKDSPDAIVYEDGAPVEPPIATAKSRRSSTSRSCTSPRRSGGWGRPTSGWRTRASSRSPSTRRSGRFGPSLRTPATASPPRSDAALVERTADRLFAPDLFSGWGIRTLSSDHPRYNPYSYQLGSIWPVEHGTFALGFWRYGLHDRVQQIARSAGASAPLV